MRNESNKLILLAMGALVLMSLLTGCVGSKEYSDWQWKQYNPNYRPLPGDPTQ